MDTPPGLTVKRRLDTVKNNNYPKYIMEVTIITDAAGSATVKPVGRLDTLSANDFDAKTEPLRVNPPKKTVIDCSELEYISSSGLRTFISLLKAHRGAGSELTLTDVSPEIQSIFQMTGLSRLFGL